MIEVLFLFRFGRSLADICRDKGRSNWWAVMGVGSWIFGELFGFIVGAALGLDGGAYVAGLGCAAACAAIAWFVVKGLDDFRAQPTIDAQQGAGAPSGAPTAGTNISAKSVR